MRICSTAYQGVIVAVGTAGQTNRYKRSMIRRRLWMARGKISAVTGVTVAGRSLANGKINQSTVIVFIMTKGTAGMYLRKSGIKQIHTGMTGTTLRTRCGHEGTVIKNN
jgi:hypothetical protein